MAYESTYEKAFDAFAQEHPRATATKRWGGGKHVLAGLMVSLVLASCGMGGSGDSDSESERHHGDAVEETHVQDPGEVQGTHPSLTGDAGTAPDGVNPQVVENEALREFLVENTAIAIDGMGEYGMYTAPAWSTVKVPIAVAALRNDPNVVGYVGDAISASDNVAAEILWNSMGGRANVLTNQILREGGDSTTQLHADPWSPEFLAFGETAWNLSDQARFASNLRCIDNHEPVLAAMGTIVEGSGYGLGLIPGALYKGGWSGDNANGFYSARQFGLLPTSDGGWVSVALSAESPDGQYETAQAMLNEVAMKLATKLNDLPRAKC